MNKYFEKYIEELEKDKEANAEDVIKNFEDDDELDLSDDQLIRLLEYLRDVYGIAIEKLKSQKGTES